MKRINPLKLKECQKLLNKLYLKIHPDTVHHICKEASSSNSKAIQTLNNILQGDHSSIAIDLDIFLPVQSGITRFKFHENISKLLSPKKRTYKLFNGLKPIFVVIGLEAECQQIMKGLKGINSKESNEIEHIRLDPFAFTNPVTEKVKGRAAKRMKQSFIRQMFHDNRIHVKTASQQPSIEYLGQLMLLLQQLDIAVFVELDSLYFRDISLVFQSSKLSMNNRRIYIDDTCSTVAINRHIKESLFLMATR